MVVVAAVMVATTNIKGGLKVAQLGNDNDCRRVGRLASQGLGR